MTISQREWRALNAIERELSLDAALTRLASLFTGPITVSPDARLGTVSPDARPVVSRPAWNSPVRLLVILALVLGVAGTVVGAVLRIPVLSGTSLVVLLTAATLFTLGVATRRARRAKAGTVPAQKN